MSANLAKFFRSTPYDSLKAYLVSQPASLSEAVNWNKPPKNVAKPLLKVANELSEDELAHLDGDAERINEMTDEIGQSALLSVVPDDDLDDYENLQNAHDRAVFVFLRDQNAFRRAEEIHYSDNYRKGRMWNNFQGPTDILVSRDPLDIENFKQKITDHFRMSRKIKVEIFDRNKAYSGDEDLHLVQVMVYREGMPESYTALEEDDLVSRIIRPVMEMALTYEPISGIIEIIAKDKETREELVKLFAETLLQTEIDAERVPLKQYEISKLLHPYDFPTDPDDGIASVKVSMLKLKPHNNGNKVTLEVTAKENRSIYEVSQEWFDTNDPLHTGFLLAQVKLSIHFMPDEENRRGKIVPVKISWPNACDLKSKTEKERLIGEKYLKRWGLLKDV